MSKSINLSPNNIMTYSWGIEVGGIQLIGAGVPMEKKFEENLVHHCLSNTWCHSLLSASDSVSISVSVSIEISKSDSDENPLWMFS